MLNANKGVHTFVKLMLTRDDTEICEMYTDEEIKTKISEEEYDKLMNTFKEYLDKNIEFQEKYNSICREIEKLNNAEFEQYPKLTMSIGSWKREQFLIYDHDIEKYTKMMVEDSLRFKVVFPINKFISV